MGFLSVSTCREVKPTNNSVCFNPVVSFLSVSTPSGRRRCVCPAGFNPVVDFLSVSTRPDGRGAGDRRRVSIPVWVFSLLRRRSSRGPARRRATGFNPVLGFLPTSTPSPTGKTCSTYPISIPSWVFSLLRHLHRLPGVTVLLVSIPSWVFSLPRRNESRRSLRNRNQFQSRSGFSPCLDSSDPTTVDSSSCFNPALGFLPASTDGLALSGRYLAGF